jgi:hypothetical protein
MVQDAISGGVITAEESPADIVEKIARAIEGGFGRLFAKEVLKNGELEQAGSSSFEFSQDQKGRVKKVFPLIDCQEGMLTWLNEKKVGEAAAILPLRFSNCPMIRVQNGGLGLYVAADQQASSGEADPNPASSIMTSMLGLLNGGKILQRFEWNGDKWQEYGDEQPAGVTRRIVRRLDSAIIRTKWGGVDEYLYVHWPENKPDKPFVKGKQWIKEFNAALEAGERPNLGEVCTLFYWPL